MDSNNLYGHTMSQLLPHDEIELWKGDPDCYMDRLDEIVNISDDSENGFF